MWIRAASNFITLIPSRSVRQMLVNFSGVEFYKTVSKFRKEKQSRCLVFTSSTKREIRHFHVQKSVMHVQSCCFAYLNLLLFCRSRCRHRRCCLSSLIFLDRDVKCWKKSMGFRFVPECNHAQESHACIFFCHICRTADCWDPEILLPWQRDVASCLHYGGRGGRYQPRWMTLHEAVLFMPIKRLIFFKGDFFHLGLSEFDNHPIISQMLNFCDVTPLFSVVLKKA